ncbi:preprotein translocase subunit SecG [Vaginisenegalia massiliensis]|uniref:preprotein translocase subunit SecG n=1 Tax=Vaginisenegalia massiliensis TaxID=2058294 RepID=UPI000F5424EB|nr:preprotein translocase subunit SecG [Vaginisenegalia massiliensis]
MYSALLTALIVVSILMIILVVMQPSKSNAASSLTGASGENPLVKQKARGFEAFLIRATVVLGVIFFALAIALAMFSAK